MADTSTKNREVELTFLASRLPAELAAVTPVRLIDVFFPDDLNVNSKLRLRQKGERFELTKKVLVNPSDPSVQEELTIPLTSEEFQSMQKASAKRVEKDRYKFDVNGHTAEVDVFLNSLNGLVVVEFEFDSESERDTFKAPDFCLVDITPEEFIAGGKLAGKSLEELSADLDRYHYKPLYR